VPAAGRQRRLHRHRARRQDRQGMWRARTIPLPGELGYETWGAVPMAERWHVGTWMVPSYDPGDQHRLRRHVGHDSGAEVHARRQRQEVPVSTTRRWRSTPTPAR
jgi:hypothetical protein